ncbi:hypothetical protein [Ruminococcus sp.]|uniref:hypothetical protein n=1 Tax=Ruminococcus sp. TaxID=41978 RepID=UPI0025EE4C50|nr:hypothetical protein [Ruminococcus sp.]
MRSARLIAIAAAAVFSVSCFSCSDNNRPPRISRYRDKVKEFKIGQAGIDNDDSTDQLPERSNLDDVEESVRKLLDDIGRSDNEEAVKADIDSLLSMYDTIYEARTNAEFIFYRNYTDKHVEALYNEYYHDAAVAADLIMYGFNRGADSDYSSLFEKLVDKEGKEHYVYSLSSARAEAESSFLDIAETKSEYYEVINDASLSVGEKDLRCAELLLELIEDYTPETFYTQYDRDYTGEEILELGKTVSDKIIPVYKEMLKDYFGTVSWSDYFSEDDSEENPFETVREYAKTLSPEFDKYSQKLIDEKLYTVCYNDDAFEGAFTDELPTQNSAKIFIGNMGNSRNRLTTAIHEFGHYYASFFDETHALMAKNNLDIAEIQSQGFELLFMQFYNDIYGKSGDSMKLYRILNIADSIVCGFLVGEFEYSIISEKDSITPEEVVDKFNDLFEELEIDYHLSDIPHIIESPGYYISYATSALASLDLLDDVMNDPAKALEKYEKMARISNNSGEYSFRAALKECGFDDVLTKEYITSLAAKLKMYSKELSR